MNSAIKNQISSLFVAIIFVVIFSFFSNKMNSHVVADRAALNTGNMSVVQCLNYVDNHR